MLSVVTLIHPPHQSVYLHSPENNTGSMFSVSTLIHSTTHPNIHTHTHAARISSLILSTQPMLICPTTHLPSHSVTHLFIHPTDLSSRPPTLSFSHPQIRPVIHLFIHRIPPTLSFSHSPLHSPNQSVQPSTYPLT